MTAIDRLGGVRAAARRRPDDVTDGPALAEGLQRSSLALFIVVALMIPNQFSFVIGGVLLTPLRIALIILFIPGILAFFSRPGNKIYHFDIIYAAFSLWTCLCILLNRGLAIGVERAGQFLLETLIIYIIVQGSIRNVAQIRAIVDMLFRIVVILLIFVVPETLTETHYIQNTLNWIVGRPPLEEPIAGLRLGVIRATSIFSHPILFGLFNASLAALIWYMTYSSTRRILQITIVFLATFSTLSSGPILIFLVQMMLIGIDHTTRWMKNRFWKIVSVIMSFLIFVNYASNRGLFVLVVIFTLNPGTAYYRRIIWENGIDDVMRNPIFGFNPENWTRPHWMKASADNYWLVQAFIGGIPSVVFLGLAIALIVFKLWRLPRGEAPDILDRLRRGWSFLILGMALCGATVHFFDKLQPYFAFQIALGAAIVRLIEDWRRAEAGRPASGPVEAVQPAQRETRRRTWM